MFSYVSSPLLFLKFNIFSFLTLSFLLYYCTISIIFKLFLFFFPMFSYFHILPSPVYFTGLFLLYAYVILHVYMT